MEQDQDFVFDLSSAREEYEEKDKDGDDCKLELTMGNAEAKPEILAAQTFGDFPETRKIKELQTMWLLKASGRILGAKMLKHIMEVDIWYSKIQGINWPAKETMWDFHILSADEKAAPKIHFNFFFILEDKNDVK
ncbi:hypothetical protein GH714_039139 [Hevea brasiliensis]|uniref:Uncharacterized protein n=1 Tax=Hevea brasiliensis TaxID=3981 RepID=A0A6A6KLR8_HEVBR|nr:hypothetical protein GH714_039139 [Hevea brasiliensis]